MKDCTLVIMAAGMGSRFGGGIKQLAPVGPNNEIIMDYSIYDAVKAGFNKVVFIIRKDIEEAFAEMIGNRISKYVNVSYVFQETDDVPEQYKNAERTKPWGTGHAILCCKGVVNEPFVIINADDYYGFEGFKILHDYLTSEHESDKLDLSMAAFILKNTLSDNGTVTRGICVADENNKVTDIEETFNIIREADGKVMADDGDSRKEVSEDSHVSMNMWGCPPEFLDILDTEFNIFLEENSKNLKSEFLLPTIIDKLIKNGEAECTLLESRDRWFGVTYAEDKATVCESISKLIENGVYPAKLWD
ncbi:MAG: nucleotidyltransferase [Ruminococcus sp.]|nr:nucleotidyltransferase [Ruminococcus sp.]